MAITVLLADDHAVLRDGLRLILEKSGDIRVAGEAADGREAVRAAQSLRPDVVIMDVAMPGLNGIDAAEQLHTLCPRCRVVILSMHGTSEHVYRAFKAGARGYLLKGSAGQEVIQAVRAVHCGNRYVSPQVADLVVEDYIRAPRLEPAPLEQLTGREREILQLVAEGKTSQEIAALLFLSPKTVETYRSRLMGKLGIEDLAGLVKFAIRSGLISLE